MPAHIARGNATRAQVRSRVEHVFAAQMREARCRRAETSKRSPNRMANYPTRPSAQWPAPVKGVVKSGRACALYAAATRQPDFTGVADCQNKSFVAVSLVGKLPRVSTDRPTARAATEYLLLRNAPGNLRD
jgi:hypothetical protein